MVSENVNEVRWHVVPRFFLENLHNLVHLYAMLHTQEDNLNSGEHDLFFYFINLRGA